MIEIRDLHVRFSDGTQALKGIDLDIPAGEFLLICGPNGSGKTTLLRSLAGLMKVTSGSIRIFGADPLGESRRIRSQIGIVFQDPDSQIVGETVWEDVAFGPENLELSPQEIKGRVEGALQMTNLSDLAQKPCYLLSGGEKKRLALAGVMAMEPKVILFDEPFANLDYPSTREVLGFMLRRQREGHTLVVTTHDLDKVSAHADRLVVLHQGRIAAMGKPEDLFAALPAFGVRPPCYALLHQKPLTWLE